MWRKKLEHGDAVVGTMLRISGNPAVVPLALNAGLDFVMADMEHAAYSFETLSNIFLVTRAYELGGFVRVPELSRGYVSRALDCGADGVMVPMIDSVEQARDFVRWAKYPPVGGRGLSSRGGHTGYLSNGDAAAHMAAANREVVTIAQIETAAGCAAVDEIAAVEGIDVLLIGPNDLEVSLNHDGASVFASREHAIERVAKAAKDHRKVFGMHADVSMLNAWAGHGLRFAMNSMDIKIIEDGLRRVARETRQALESPRELAAR